MRNILLVIDMQNDFIDGSLGTPEAVGIVENVKKKIKEYNIDSVYATRDTHEENYLDTHEGKNLPVPHCIRGTDGWQIRDDIAELIKEENIIDKPVFGSYELVDKMKELNEKEEITIELVGLCTDICVASNALLLRSALTETDISVDSSCTAGVTPESHEAALETMKMCQVVIK